jgi:capsular polysaccharide biosynthesis protein
MEQKLIKASLRVVAPSMLTLSPTGVDPVSVYGYFGLGDRIRTNAVGFGSLLKNGLTLLPRGANYFHLFNVWGTGYYHWLTEIAPKFLQFESEIREGQTLVPRNQPPYIREFFEMFRFEDLIPVTKCFLAPKLNLVTNPAAGRHDPNYIRPVRLRVFEALGIESTDKAKRIYVSRRKAARRKVINEDEVIDRLRQDGFECLELEDVSFAEQVRLFAQCETLVSIHGAAIANCIFMPPDSKVIELYPASDSKRDIINPCFYNLCSAVGIGHSYLFSTRSRPENRFDFHTDDIHVDVDHLASLISQ